MDERFNEDGLALSANYEDTMENIVRPWLKQREQTQTVEGQEGKPLY